ncbi:MAG: response regulator [Ferruginibacter sp.]|nr:response regulator [Ferruginibacter sp.]
MKALIIDDEIDTCFVLSGILKQKNFASDCVNTLGDAANKLAKEQPGIVFLNNHLPDGRGIDFVEHIRKTSKDIKIVLIGAYETTVTERINAMNKGVDLFIGKPFTTEAINQSVDRLIA